MNDIVRGILLTSPLWLGALLLLPSTWMELRRDPRQK
jgi:hypothetical protein